MRPAWSALVCSLGFFSIVAQALLFRAYLASFEGNELAIGSFFGSWLLWVALGALVGRAVAGRVRPSPRALAALALLYLPAFALQAQLTLHARDLAGVAAYEIFPLDAMILVSLLANAPVSLCTGLLFTLACRTAADAAGGLPVARVYVLECLGGFGGGLVVTVLLATGLEGTTVFGVAGLVLSASVALVGLRAGARAAPAVPVALALPFAGILVALLLGADQRLAAARDEAAWTRLLPADAYRGRFVTGQGRYLYGEREGTFEVLSWGVTTETVPDAVRGGEVAAIHLAQHPRARRVLVVGASSLPVCLAFAALPQVEEVAWLHPDADYPATLWNVLPTRLRGDADKLVVPATDLHAWLRDTSGRYDLALLNLPDVTTLVQNRCATRELFVLLRGALAPDGVASLRISGGENYLGGELLRLGASALATLESVFTHVVLKPGEETWLIASDGLGLRVAPAALRDRFAAVAGAAAVYPPEALLGLYLPDRMAFQMERYRRALDEAPAALLLNTERRPQALLHSLALSLRRAGRPGVATDLPVLVAAGAWVLAGGLLLYGLLRALYLGAGGRPGVSASTARPVPRPFDAGVLVLTTGGAGMALGVVLMFLYQSRFGSLYLDVGIVASLFMLGLFLGGRGAERLLARLKTEGPHFLPAGLLAYVGLVALVALPLPDVPRALFGALFVLAGAVSGFFFPLAAHRLRSAGLSVTAAGATLETVDHLGGAVAAVLTGLFLLPLFGTTTTLALIALLVAVNVAPLTVPRRARAARPVGTRADRWVRAGGYALVGVTAWTVLSSVAFASARGGRAAERLGDVARDLVGGRALRAESAPLEGGEVVSYFAVGPDDAGEVEGYVFSTARLAPDVVGYGGPVVLAVHVDRDGLLQGFEVLTSRETPAYLRRLDAWRETLRGRDLFAADPFAGVDTVSGATLTADAVRRTLAEAGRRFAREVLGREVAGASAPPPPPLDWRFLLLAGLTAAAIALRYAPHPWLRRAFLALVLAVGGLWLNLQYSAHQVSSLVHGALPVLRASAALFLVLVVPVVVLLFGNVYCGWLCPFGGAQELLGDVGRRRWRTDPHRETWRWGRALKYVLLALVLVVVALSGRREALAADPLVTLFGGAPVPGVLVLAAAVLALSVAFGRFWCRSLCPAGAFLALLNRVQLLRRLLPATRPGRCDLGVRDPHELDCICCDRCRHASDPD